jgi:hypothetical protein
MENNRYKELKYEGKTYTQKYQIDEILLSKGMNWFLDCEMENMRIEIMKDTLIINGGVFYNGVFEYGVIRDIEWRSGTFQNGVIYNGTFKRIKVEKGIIFDGIFVRGDVLFADIRGGEFKDVNISNNVNQTEHEEVPQEQDFEVQPETTQVQSQAQPVQVEGEVPQGQEGQEIQSQVQERYVKTFESFLGFGKKKAARKEQTERNEEILKELYDMTFTEDDYDPIRYLFNEGDFDPSTWFRESKDGEDDTLITKWAGISLKFNFVKGYYVLDLPVKFNSEYKNIVEQYINKNHVLISSNDDSGGRSIKFSELTPGFY